MAVTETSIDSTMVVDADTVVSHDAAGLFIMPDMTVGVDILQQYMGDVNMILPHHVQRVFELSLCITSPDIADQKRFWSLVDEIAKKRMHTELM